MMECMLGNMPHTDLADVPVDILTTFSSASASQLKHFVTSYSELVLNRALPDSAERQEPVGLLCDFLQGSVGL